MASFEFKSPHRKGLDYLRDYHTFGRRKDSVDTYVNHSYISKIHAIIEWREPNWLLKDVSKNGLKLNGLMIPAQKAVLLSVDDVIDFAGMGEATLTIKDLDPPTSMLINQSLADETIAIDESTLLPNDEEPELALYLCPDRGQWYAERISEGIEAGPYEHGDLIKLGNNEWRFLMVTESDATTEFTSEPLSLDEVKFQFDMSQDEENIELTLIENGMEVELGERSHHYLMVHLLRHRRDDPQDKGWIDCQLLMKELGIEESHLNIQIFRARKQIAAALPEVKGHSRLIERRRGSVRIGVKNFEISKEGTVEA